MWYAYSHILGPRLDWDPEIVAALDSDNDEPMDDDMDDDFIALANESGDDDELAEDGSFRAELADRQKKWIEEQMLGHHEGYVICKLLHHTTLVLLSLLHPGTPIA